MKKFLFLSMISACICINETDAVTYSHGTQPVTTDIQGNSVTVNVDLTKTETKEDTLIKCNNAAQIDLVIAPGIEKLSPELFEQFFGKDTVAMLKAKVKSVSIPDSVKEIADNCFNGWQKLSKVYFGSSSKLERIGNSAFYKSGLREIAIPDAVKVIGARCFRACNSLAKISFGANSTLKEAYEAWAPDSKLKSVNASFILAKIRFRNIDAKKNPALKEALDTIKSNKTRLGANSALKEAYEAWDPDSKLKIVYPYKIHNVIMKTIYGFYSIDAIPRFEIIDKTNTIQTDLTLKYYDAQGTDHTATVKLDDENTLSLLSLDRQTAEQIVALTVPKHIKVIDYGCFMKCKNLQKVEFESESQLESIRQGAFSYTNIRQINIPDSVTELETRCFYGCKGLTNITFGMHSKLARIGCGTFTDTGLTEISIPDSVIDIGNACFSGCQSLNSISFGKSSQLEPIQLLCQPLSHKEKVDELSPEQMDSNVIPQENRPQKKLLTLRLANKATVDKLSPERMDSHVIPQKNQPQEKSLTWRLPNKVKVDKPSPERMDSHVIPQKNQPQENQTAW